MQIPFFDEPVNPLFYQFVERREGCASTIQNRQKMTITTVGTKTKVGSAASLNLRAAAPGKIKHI
jgi:hypothetical protein